VQLEMRDADQRVGAGDGLGNGHFGTVSAGDITETDAWERKPSAMMTGAPEWSN
jgi:hypothetical protein